MRTERARIVAVAAIGLLASAGARSEELYVEPGTLRLTHEIAIESVLHRAAGGWRVAADGLNKEHIQDPAADEPWKAEWGQSLLTEVATRLPSDVFGRVLFEAQGDYADRYWRPVNINHYIDDRDRHVFLRQAEGRIDRDDWFVHAFSGVGHTNWEDKGDFFGLYPASFPDDDWLGQSGYFGLSPERYRQDLFLNISRRHVPQGIETWGRAYGLDASVAYGSELAWGYNQSVYGRLSAPVGPTSVTFVVKDEDVPYAVGDEDERNRAYALAWNVPSEKGHRFDVGVLYNPFRLDEPYRVVRDAAGGTGVQGSAYRFDEKTTKKKDAIAARARYERRDVLFSRELQWGVDLTRAGVVAGNKEQLDLRAATNLLSTVRGSLLYTYRRPVEDPIPFLYEGTPENVGAIVAFPRGPEAPFWVNWQNREAVFVTATVAYDPTPGTSLFRFSPEVLQGWNINSDEDASFTVATQYRMSDYRGTTDRQYYYDVDGDIVWEPATRTGAWPSNGPLHEFRVLGHGRADGWLWTLGVAGGQSPAPGGLAYSKDTTQNKPLTEYYSIEGRIDVWPFGFWGHYGTGVWGPEPFQQFFGESFDRLFGGGIRYNITKHTRVDLSYLSARQEDQEFVAPDLGDYDEIRAIFSHRFGFLFQFDETARPGYEAR